MHSRKLQNSFLRKIDVIGKYIGIVEIWFWNQFYVDINIEMISKFYLNNQYKMKIEKWYSERIL